MEHRPFSALAVLGAVTLAVSAFAQPVPDHLGCYKVKDSARGRFTITVTNAGVTQRCSVKLPAKVACLETQKSDVVPAPPGGGPSPTAAGNFLCYRMKCPRPFPPDFEMEDQFGRRVVDFRAGQLLCAPARRGVATIVSSTTTTMPPSQCHFSESDHRCEGRCGGGGHCAATASSGACECRSTACGDAGTPECNGFCTEAGEACVFSVDGCSCVRIP
jgi:hypothetical protein